MKVKNLIEKLQTCNLEAEANISVYDCGGFNDSYPIDYVDERIADDHTWIQIEISVGCDTHKKWIDTGNCPVDNIKKEIADLDKVRKIIENYETQLAFLEKRFAERNKK